MAIGFLTALALQAAATPACSGVDFQVAVSLALEARKRADPDAARRALEPIVASCPASTLQGYSARALAADTAAGAGDWRAARALAGELELDRPGPLAPRVAFLRLAADKALADSGAYTRDRTATLAANDSGLAARGRRIETFQAGPYAISAYEAVVQQGAFKRLLEFVGTPADPSGYPVSVMLTDDLTVDKIGAELAAKDASKPAAGRVYFVDLYTCTAHSTLLQREARDGAAPAYAEVKALVLKTLAAPPVTVPPPPPTAPPAAPCPSAVWLAPGLGLSRATTPPTG